MSKLKTLLITDWTPSLARKLQDALYTIVPIQGGPVPMQRCILYLPGQQVATHQGSLHQHVYVLNRCDGKPDCKDRGDEQVAKFNNFLTQVFWSFSMDRVMEMIALSWSFQKVTAKMNLLELRRETSSPSTSQSALSASWRSMRSVKPWKWFLRWSGPGLMPGWRCYTSKRTPIWMFSGRRTLKRYGIQNFSLKTLTQVKTIQNDISSTWFYETWTSPQLYETLAPQIAQMSSKDQNTRFYELKSTPITGGASTTWSGILSIGRDATCGWNCPSTTWTLWDWIRKRLSSPATRTSWQSILWTKSSSALNQMGLGWFSRWPCKYN